MLLGDVADMSAGQPDEFYRPLPSALVHNELLRLSLPSDYGSFRALVWERVCNRQSAWLRRVHLALLGVLFPQVGAAVLSDLFLRWAICQIIVARSVLDLHWAVLSKKFPRWASGAFAACSHPARTAILSLAPERVAWFASAVDGALVPAFVYVMFSQLGC